MTVRRTQQTLVLVLSAWVLGCGVYQKQTVEIDAGLPPSWIVIEYSNRRCQNPGAFRQRLSVSPAGFACTASELPAFMDWTCVRVDGNTRTELRADEDYHPGSTMQLNNRKFQLIEYTPAGQRANENAQDAVYRYLKANPD